MRFRALLLTALRASKRQFPVGSATADLETLYQRMVRNGEPYEKNLQPRNRGYGKSKSITSDACLASRSKPRSSLTAAPSLTASATPFISIDPRNTCTQA